MSNLRGFIERLRIIAKALEESEPMAKQRALLALRAAADHIEKSGKPPQAPMLAAEEEPGAAQSEGQS